MTLTRDAAAKAWLAAIAADGWHAATLDQAAEGPGVAAADIVATLGDKFDAAGWLADTALRQAAIGAAGPGSSRDRLFDGMMQGLDALQAERAAVLAMWAARDPGLLLLVIGRSGAGLRRLALAAGVTIEGPRGQLRLAALGALVTRLFHVWRADESADLAASMAELDRLLARAERAEAEGLSADLIGLPGLRSLVDRLPWRAGRGDRDPPPSPDPTGE